MKVRFLKVPIIEINNQNFVLLDDCIQDFNSENKKIKIVLDKKILSNFFDCDPDQVKIQSEFVTFLKEKKVIQREIRKVLKEISVKTNMKDLKSWFLRIMNEETSRKENGINIGFESFILKMFKENYEEICESFPKTNIKTSETNINLSKTNTKTSKTNVTLEDVEEVSSFFLTKKLSNSKTSNEIQTSVNNDFHKFLSENCSPNAHEYLTLFREFKYEVSVYFKLFKLLKIYTIYYNILNCVAIAPYAPLPRTRVAKAVPKKEKTAWKEKENDWRGVPEKLWKAKHVFQYFEFKSRKTYGKNSFEIDSYKGRKSRAITFSKIKKQLIAPFEENKFVDKEEIKTYLDWVFDKEAKSVKFKINLQFVLSPSVMDNWLKTRKGAKNVSENREKISSDLWK